MKAFFVSRWLVAAGIAALVVAACGGGDEATATPRPTAPPQATATSTPRPQATTAPAATAPPQATTAPSGQPTATPAAGSTATPRPLATPVPTSTPAPTVPPAAEGKYGGFLRKALPGDAASWDPYREVSMNTQDVLQPVYDQLIALNPQNEAEIVPQLAESWTISSDNLTYTFRLRRGVTFSNGNPLTAQDVKFSYEHVLNPPAGTVPPIRSSLSSIGTITTPDDYTVAIKLKGPDASIMLSLGQGRTHIVDKEFVDKEGKDRLGRWPPVGTGPFVGRDDGLVRGVSARVVRRQDHWVKGRPYLDGAQFFVVPDTGSRLAAFLTGQINFDYTLGPDEEKEARAKLGNRLFTQTTGTANWSSLEINTLREPFTNIKVRQAVALAADKYGYIQVNQKGRGVIGGFLAPGTGWELPTAELKAYEGYKEDRTANVARAKQLLAEAGFPNGFKIKSYFTRQLQPYIDASILLKGMLEEVGITGELEIIDTGKFFGDLSNPQTNWVLSWHGHNTPLVDPNSAYQTFHLCAASRNYTGVCDKKIQDLYDAQNLATDPAKRKQTVWEMERYTLGLYHNAVLSFGLTVNGRHANIKDYKWTVAYQSNRQFRDVWME